MSEHSFNQSNLPDFSGLREVIDRIQELTKPVIEIAQNLQRIVQPIIEATSAFQAKFQSIATEMAKAFRPLRAAEKLGEAQYVYWKPLSAEMVDVIIETKNLNKTLREILVKEKFKSTYDTIDTCIRNPMLKGNLRLFEQAVVAFNSGHNDLAVNGFTSVFDGVLSEISGKPTHKLGPRIKVIMDKLEREEVLENDEYAVMYLALTFQSAVESFSKQAPFDEPEPHNLNRHWIAHGRTRRRKTKLDCVKMINLIYGLLLVHELDNRIDS